MHVGSDHGDDARLAGNDQGLRDGQTIDEAETRAADIERTAGLPGSQVGMKAGSERRIDVVGLAGGHDPVDFVRGAAGGVKRLLRRARAEGELILAIRGVRERLDAGAAAEFADGHAEGAVDVFGREHARASHKRRAGQKDAALLSKIPLVILDLLAGGQDDVLPLEVGLRDETINGRILSRSGDADERARKVFRPRK